MWAKNSAPGPNSITYEDISTLAGREFADLAMVFNNSKKNGIIEEDCLYILNTICKDWQRPY